MGRKKHSTVIVLLAVLPLLVFSVAAPVNGEFVVVTNNQLQTTSSAPPPAPFGAGPGFVASAGIISFSSLNTSNVSLAVSQELSVVDLLNTLVIAPAVNGTVYLAYSLPLGVTAYVSTSPQGTLLGTTTILSGTALAGNGGLETSGAFPVTAGQPLYISFVLDANLASTGFIQADFAV